MTTTILDLLADGVGWDMELREVVLDLPNNTITLPAASQRVPYHLS